MSLQIALEETLDNAISTVYQGYWARRYRVAVDRASPDGYLDGVREAFPNAAQHASTIEMAGGLILRPLRGRGLLVAGHGKPGVLKTGSSGSHTMNGTRLSVTSAATWVPLLSSLRGNISRLLLLGCNVGAERDGLALMKKLACELQTTVIAPTGAVLALDGGKIRLQRGSVWQTVTCRSDDRAIAAPDMNFPWPKTRLSPIGRFDETRVVQAPYAGHEIISLHFVPRDSPAPEFYLNSAEATNFLRLVSPIGTRLPEGSGIAAIDTADVTIEYAIGGVIERQQYRLRADSFLQDVDDERNIFAVSRQFGERAENINRWLQ